MWAEFKRKSGMRVLVNPIEVSRVEELRLSGTGCCMVYQSGLADENEALEIVGEIGDVRAALDEAMRQRRDAGLT